MKEPIASSRPQTAPVVSVHMLTYNHESYVAEAIEGVLSQDVNFPIELVISDDFSTDRTIEIAERYRDAAPDIIRLIKGDKNIGIMPNFYRASSACRGDFVAFCEGDDVWCDPQKLRKQVEIFRCSDDIGLVHGDFLDLRCVNGQWVKSSKSAYELTDRSLLEGELFARFVAGHIPRTCTVMIRSELLSGIHHTKMGSHDYLVGDVPLFIYCAAHSRVGYIPDVLALYRHLEGSATRSGFSATVRRLESVLEIYRDIHFEFGSREDYDHHAEVPILRWHMNAAFRISDRKSFKSSFRRLRHHGWKYIGFGSLVRSLLLDLRLSRLTVYFLEHIGIGQAHSR